MTMPWPSTLQQGGSGVLSSLDYLGSKLGLVEITFISWLQHDTCALFNRIFRAYESISQGSKFWR